MEAITSQGQKDLSGWFEKNSRMILFGILSLALVLRWMALLDLKGSIYYDYLLWDERLYHAWAMKIAADTLGPATPYEFPPFPAYVIALIYKLLGPYVLYIRIFNIGLGVLTCYLMFLMGEKMSGRNVGLLAGIMAALYQPFIFYNIVPLKTSLAVFLFAVCSYLFVSTVYKLSMFQGFLLGLCSGLLINTRPNYLAVLPFSFLAILWKTRFSQKVLLKHGLLFVGGISLAISPFVIRNYLVTGRVSFLVSEFGYNLYLGNNPPNPEPYYRPVPFANPSPFVQGTQFQIEASRRTGKKLSPEEASGYWVREALNTALAEPETLVKKLGQKTLAVFNQFEAGDHYHIGFLSDHVRFFKWPLPALWLMLPLGMAGMVTGVRRSGTLAALSVVFLLYSFSLVVTYTSTRIRLPLLTILLPFAALGISHLVSWCKRKDYKDILAYAITICIFASIEFLPLPGTKDLSAYYNTHAIILASRGSVDEAVDYWKKSAEMNQAYSAFANLSLAGKYYTQKDRERALHYLEQIPDTSFAAAQKYALMGRLWDREREYEKAIAPYEKSLHINSGDLNTQKRFVEILDRVDPSRAKVEREKFKYLSSFYDGI